MIRNITTNNPATKNKHRPHNKNTNSKNLKNTNFGVKINQISKLTISKN